MKWNEICPKKGIVLVTKPGCTFCDDCIKFLKQKKRAFKKITTNDAIEACFTKSFHAYPYVPKVVINDSFIGGYDELQKYFVKKKKRTNNIKRKSS